MIRPMHEQMTRLYKAANELKGATSPSGVARLLNMAQQNVKNWEYRGISAEGLLLCQEKIGCNAIWLRDGVGEMTITSATALLDAVNLRDAIAAAIELDRKGGLKLPPEKLGILAAFWYEEWQDKGQRHTPTLNDANRILRLVA